MEFSPTSSPYPAQSRVAARAGSRGGGGGTRDINWWGCALAHQKRGVLGAGTAQKGGVLGAGTAPKKGGLRCGHNQKKGGLRHIYNPKKGEFRTDLVKREGVRN